MNETLNTSLRSVLAGHVSPETAYLVNDYPYGFRLRCKIRYWLEHHPKRGTRFVSQTTNPKRRIFNAASGLYTETWNKPKASTYADVAGAMYLDGSGHVQWSGLTYYPDAAECAAWLAQFSEGVPAEVFTKVDKLVAQKRVYERAKATGMDYRYAGLVATLWAKGHAYEEALARVNVAIQNAKAAETRGIVAGVDAIAATA